MESVYVPGTNKERAEVEKPAIDLYELTRKIQYHVIRNMNNYEYYHVNMIIIYICFSESFPFGIKSRII